MTFARVLCHGGEFGIPRARRKWEARAMFGSNRTPQEKPSVFATSIKWAATAGAAAITFISAAPLVGFLSQPVHDYTLNRYGDLDWLTHFGLWMLTIGFVFSATRAALVGGITTLAMYVAAKFS